MSFLLDTHVWLWLLTDPELLPRMVRDALKERRVDVVLSSVSIWEAAVKVKLGKLPLREPLSFYLAASTGEFAMRVLDIKPAHALALADLSLHHRDPFDRMLVAQAMREELSLVTADPALYAYDVDLLWAGPGRPPVRRGGSGRVGERPRPRRKVVAAGTAGGRRAKSPTRRGTRPR